MDFIGAEFRARGEGHAARNYSLRSTCDSGRLEEPCRWMCLELAEAMCGAKIHFRFEFFWSAGIGDCVGAAVACRQLLAPRYGGP